MSKREEEKRVLESLAEGLRSDFGQNQEKSPEEPLVIEDKLLLRVEDLFTKEQWQENFGIEDPDNIAPKKLIDIIQSPVYKEALSKRMPLDKFKDIVAKLKEKEQLGDSTVNLLKVNPDDLSEDDKIRWLQWKHLENYIRGNVNFESTKENRAEVVKACHDLLERTMLGLEAEDNKYNADKANLKAGLLKEDEIEELKKRQFNKPFRAYVNNMANNFLGRLDLLIFYIERQQK